jgi:SRSO17 transposase
MSSREQKEPTSEEEVLRLAEEELNEVQKRIGPHFRRAEARGRARCYVQGLLAQVERKNGWQVAEVLGEHGPRAVQRLLGEADWDEEAVRDRVRE